VLHESDNRRCHIGSIYEQSPKEQDCETPENVINISLYASILFNRDIKIMDTVIFEHFFLQDGFPTEVS